MQAIGARGLAILAAVALLIPAVAAAEPATLPQGKPVSMHVGVPPGGGNDQIMRLVARAIGNHLPGSPSVVARNTPGAGGRRLAAQLAHTAPRDGTEMGMLHRGLVMESLLGDTSLPFKLSDLAWIGTPSSTTDSCIVWHTAPVQSMQDIMERELIIAGDGNESWQVSLLQRLIGAKIRAVIGYPGGAAMNLALERGEVGGRCNYSWQALKTALPDWLRDKKVKPIVQFALERNPELPDVPLILDFATNDLDRKALRVLMTSQVFGFPFAAPGQVSPETLRVLRTAFQEAMKDPQTHAEAKKMRFEIAPVRGEVLAEAAREALAASPEVIARAKELVSAK